MDVVVIGGGPAGMMAAGMAAGLGARVRLVERNEKLGKKLYITGKGRCNVTNFCDEGEFISNVVTNSKFLYSAIRAFSPADTVAFLEKYGCKIKVERGRRVFPQSGKASDVTAALFRFLRENGAEIMLNTCCLGVERVQGGFKVATDEGVLFAHKVIICTGGASYPSTGSTGEMFVAIEKLGHAVSPLRPALCPIVLKEKFVGQLAGLTLKNVGLSAFYEGKKVFSGFGEMLFTHDGISGPVALSMSSHINKTELNRITIILDLKPALDEKALYDRINRDFLGAKNKFFKNSLTVLLPKSLIPIIIDLSKIPPQKQANSVTAEERRALARLLKRLEFHPESLADFEEAIVTCGGVDVKQINPSTMESKLVQGLFFAGEVIDFDALTGGFNIQAALSTGYLAGKGAAEE